MRSLKDICEASLLDNAISEASILDIEGTIIDGDDIVKSPKYVLDVKCEDIQQVADVISKCIGKKIKVKKLTGKWIVCDWGNRINVDKCPGFAIEHIGTKQFGDAPIQKIWFANWDGRLICKQEIYDYSRKPGGSTGNIAIWTPAEMANIKNYTKHRVSLGVVGSGTLRNDHIYHWGEDSLWEWLSIYGFERFFDKI